MHSTPTSNCGWPDGIVVVARIISVLPKILKFESMFGPKQSEVFKLHDVIGQFINSEFAIISF